MTSRENGGPGARGTWAPCSLLQDRVHAKCELVTEEKAGETVQWYLLFGFDEIASWVEKECDQSYDSETCVEDDQGAGRLEGNTILENTPGTASWAAL